jgi:hypothetical protein
LSHCWQLTPCSPFLAVSIADIDDDIAVVEDSLDILAHHLRRRPRDGTIYAIYALYLVTIGFVKVFLLLQKEDLDKYILLLTEAILLPPKDVMFSIE